MRTTYCRFDIDDDPDEPCLCRRRNRDALWWELAQRVYPMPHPVLSDQEHRRANHRDLPDFDDDHLVLELYRVLVRACLSPNSHDVWWLLERHDAVLAERTRRATTPYWQQAEEAQQRRREERERERLDQARWMMLEELDRTAPLLPEDEDEAIAICGGWRMIPGGAAAGADDEGFDGEDDEV